MSLLYEVEEEKSEPANITKKKCVGTFEKQRR